MTPEQLAEARALIEPLTGYIPGPWVTAGDHHVRANGGKTAIAEMRLASARGGGNGRLIAAAPELRDMVAKQADHIEAQARREAEKDARIAALLAEWDAWEGGIILNGDWSGETVRLTQEQHDWMLRLQDQRNAVRATLEARP